MAGLIAWALLGSRLFVVRSVVVTGTPQRIAGWLTGRSHRSALSAPGGIPELPSWI